ncbi:glucosidase 2 subunit beta isoform X1 [Lingula anatina]|uniref:Glucosidase 2 subunit beta n=1 Tax=Lingula anatina TaxID=7574 RepID=A0A1S3JSV5_LINAN|nr:glucosidase 2 subunit beta isoform X1 [Lingula anatina]|eukprot:XP_013413455.1 glucosidase 2 subunit beta isoform X1 [Lingula anatina]
MADKRGHVVSLRSRMLCSLCKTGQLILINILLLSLSQAKVDRPRGVSISKSSLYKPGDSFTCFDNSDTIPYSQINDDYCDCKDGSDEPGTSACPNGSFHCTNAGYRPLTMPSSRVNDGICDCCDGTDEYSGETTCVNTCREMGRAMREEQERMKQLLQEGVKIRDDYIKQGKDAKTEKRARLEALEKEKDEAEAKKNELENIKNEAEKPEKEAKDAHQKAWEEEKSLREAEKEAKKVEEAFAELDSNADGIITTSELATHPEFDKNSDGQVSEQEQQEYLEDHNSVDIKTFQEKVWPNIKDIIKFPEPEKEESAKGEATPPGEEMEEGAEFPEEAEVAPSPETKSQGGEDEDLGDDDDEEEEDYDKDDEDYEKDDEDHEYGTDEKKEEEEEEKMPDYDEETKVLIQAADNARHEFTVAEQKFKDLENEMNDLNHFLTLDLGPDDAFYPLKGQCFEYTDREYVYKLCPFDKASQRPKNGGSETSLGTWGKWTGPEENIYLKMKYERGQGCWNGPDRSATITLHCGMKNELRNVAEPNRCEYTFDFETPAACTAPAKQSEDIHDEL